MKERKIGFSFCIPLVTVTIFLFGLISAAPFAYGEEEKKDLPPRGISVAPDYTGVIDPALEAAEEKKLRRTIVEKALVALQTEVEEQTVFEF